MGLTDATQEGDISTWRRSRSRILTVAGFGMGTKTTRGSVSTSGMKRSKRRPSAKTIPRSTTEKTVGEGIVHLEVLEVEDERERVGGGHQ
ncbi:hypothetical protein GUJ93_ZPchr0007g5706 [Zizania palustris]|uniref:Uncharacterized protein n=1 Tax=Zizania palustris TaxID=103762 RepID=A0A8J5TG53_ZIZPA|nr:hypothetical protein GUJ93_ZPchr0007g5706 [Zizania palustris]